MRWKTGEGAVVHGMHTSAKFPKKPGRNQRHQEHQRAPFFHPQLGDPGQHRANTNRGHLRYRTGTSKYSLERKGFMAPTVRIQINRQQKTLIGADEAATNNGHLSREVGGQRGIRLANPDTVIVIAWCRNTRYLQGYLRRILR
jgi:hypothetical protein